MTEKIALLSDHLPVFLVENRSLYGILSKGVHDLTEEECLSFFPAVKVAIELILDDKLEQMERDRKVKKAKAAINTIASSITK